MLSRIDRQTWAFPSGQERRLRGEAHLDDVGHREFLDQLRVLSIDHAQA